MVIALVGLTVVDIPFLTVMGLAAAGTVAIAVLIALTLLPAAARLRRARASAGVNRVLGYRPARARRRETLSVRWARFVTRRPLAVLLAGLALLVVVAMPALAHEARACRTAARSPTSTTERRAYDLLTEASAPASTGR